MTCDCLHFCEADPQPLTTKGKVNKKHRWWLCIDCGAMVILKASVFIWVGINGGKWRMKKK